MTHGVRRKSKAGVRKEIRKRKKKSERRKHWGRQETKAKCGLGGGDMYGKACMYVSSVKAATAAKKKGKEAKEGIKRTR